MPSSTMPAVWTTAVRGCSSGMRVSSVARASRSAMSQGVRVTVAPRSVSSVTSSAAPSASGPRRLVRSRWRTPWAVTRWRATSAPSPPVAPVTRAVPSGSRAGASVPVGATRASRGTRIVPVRRTSWSSPEASAAGSARQESSSSSRSRRTNRPGCSAWTDRTMPHSGACTRSSASGPVARRVTTTSRAVAKRSSASHVWSSSRAAWTVSRTADSAPSAAVPGANGTSTVPARPASSSAAATCATGWPASASASARAAPSWPRTTRLPGLVAVAVTGSSGQLTRNSASPC